MEPLLTRAFVLASVANLFNGVAFALFLHLSGFLGELGASEARIGFIFGLAAVASLLVRPLVGGAPALPVACVVDDRVVLVCPHRLLRVHPPLCRRHGYGNRGALLHRLCRGGDPGAHHAGHGFAFPILTAFLADRAPIGDRGSAMAFFTALFDIGTLVGGPTLGAIIDGAGYTEMYMTAGVLLAVATAVFALWERRGVKLAALLPAVEAASDG